MDIESLRASTPTAAAEAPTSPSGAMGRDAFMRLLLAQIRHQDPLAPQDATQLVTQLAQLTQVEELARSREQLEGLATGMVALANAGTTDLVGRTVVVRSDRVIVGDTGPAEIGFTLGAAAESTTITLRDESGRTVRTLEVGARPAGLASVPWDGLDEAGQRVPPGMYSASVEAIGADGEPVDVRLEARGVVGGIDYSRGYAELLIGDIRAPAGDVLRVEQSASEEREQDASAER